MKKSLKNYSESIILLQILTDHNGYFPVKIESLAEGSVVYPHVPVYQITATGEFSPLCTYLETLLTMIWVCNLLSVYLRSFGS